MRSLLILPLLLAACSQNPHVDVSPAGGSGANAQATQADSVADANASGPGEPISTAISTATGTNGKDDKDTDGDGVPDSQDDCPYTPGPASNHGCPVDAPLADRDHDGVPDIYDKCPDEAGPVFNDGCPLEDLKPAPTSKECPYREGNEAWHRVRLEVKESLKFDFDKHDIKPISVPALRHLEDFLRRYPLSHLFMVGHTDDVGTDAYNMRLSAARVFAVKAFLVRNGIASERISVEARGRRDPLVSTEGKEGAALDHARALNRRVDLDVRYEATERGEQNEQDQAE